MCAGWIGDTQDQFRGQDNNRERVESLKRLESPGGQRAADLLVEDQNCEGERHCMGRRGDLNSALQEGLTSGPHLVMPHVTSVSTESTLLPGARLFLTWLTSSSGSGPWPLPRPRLRGQLLLPLPHNHTLRMCWPGSTGCCSP